MKRTGHVSEGVSGEDAVGVFRVVPLQADRLQVRLPDSEAPGGAGYLGKEKRVGEVRGWRGGQDEENKQSTSMKVLISGNPQARQLPSQSPRPIQDKPGSDSRVPLASAVD